MTKNSVRIYENKKKALMTYGKPIIAVPLAAISKIERIMFDLRDDGRMECIDQATTHLNKNMFELFLQDEFLPIYSHQQYSKMFKDSSLAMELSPRKGGQAHGLS